MTAPSAARDQAGATATVAPQPRQQQPGKRPREPPLTLGRAPLRTLYWFGLSVVYGLRDAAHFVATHPVTLFLALPALFYYGAARALDYNPASTDLMEVGGWLIWEVGWLSRLWQP
jgi:hypothetical protein